MSRRRLLVLMPLLGVLAGCGYFMSGRWKDDPKNWSRVFGTTKPPDVTVVHSLYWRSPHWTYEFEYYFEIAPNAALKHQLFTENKLRKLTGDAAARARDEFIIEPAPDWFAPKPADAYEVWLFADEPKQNFAVWIDRSSGAMFLHDGTI
jgi:hypothetical protein